MLEQGQHIHSYALDLGNRKVSSFLGSTLVDMYTRCGSLADACSVFDYIEERDVALWNAMISGYGQYGFALNAFELVSQMDYRGVPLNNVTFVGLLSACSHAGLLDEGLQVFCSSTLDCSVSKTIEQCICMVDLLGRAGCLHEALIFVLEMPLQPDATIWLALVGVCRLNYNVELATGCVGNLLEVEPENAVALVLLSNIVYEAD
ncbi:hypothetical protein L7F22_066989 [Adiantum nelumboides]|nr:hypothetical protein [Adiantum nelumboides]